MKNKERRGINTILKYLLIFSIVSVIVVTLICLIFAIYIEKNIDKTVDESLFVPVGTGSSTKIYYYEFEDRENRIGDVYEISDQELYGGYRCKNVSYDQIPQDLIDAFISIEDKRFLSHNGVDWKRTISAGANYFLNFSDSYGGSTITQQLIKNVTQNDEYSFQRKLQEIFWALDLETKMDKKEILNMYLNVINLSQGCFGVGAAAEYYFSKDISELTLGECVCIAAITNSPTYYNPIKNPQNNKARRDLILSQMLEQGYIDQNEYEQAKNTPIIINVPEASNTSDVNSWYLDMVIDDVINDLMEEYGYSRAMANLMIYTGGLKIYTVMDKDIQEKLEAYYSNTNNFPASDDENKLQSSSIVIDPKTGDILGVAGSIGEKKANRLQNFATQTLRPAGSVIKPLSVYAPALEKGIIDWSTVYDDVPINFGNYNLDPSKGKIVTPVAWPKNANNTYRGLTNINYAISHSINTVTVRVLEDLGLDSSFYFLYDKLKMKNLVISETLSDGSRITDKDYAALALGQFNYGVTLRETTAAYSIFANNGVYNEYRSYLKVTDHKGATILSKAYSGEAVLSEENASIMTLMLCNVTDDGTATDITLRDKIDVAGKTGTTQNNYDKWFIGYTPYYICGTWVGYEYPKPLTGFSGNICNSIWDDVMSSLHREILNDKEIESFDLSPDIIEAEYCVDSGKIMTDACRADPRGIRAEKGYFAKGSEPHELCDTHLLVSYDSEYGGILSNACPSENAIQVGLINVVRSFPAQIYVTDAQYVFRDIGKTVMPETSSDLPFFSNLLKENEFCGISKASKQYNRYCREHFNYFKWKEEKDKYG